MSVEEKVEEYAGEGMEDDRKDERRNVGILDGFVLFGQRERTRNEDDDEYDDDLRGWI